MLEKIWAFLQVPPKTLPWHWDKCFFFCWFFYWSSIRWWKPSFSVMGKVFNFILYKIGKIFPKTTVGKTVESNWDLIFRPDFWWHQINVQNLPKITAAIYVTERVQVPSQWQPAKKVENHLLVSANKIWWDTFFLHVPIG